MTKITNMFKTAVRYPRLLRQKISRYFFGNNIKNTIIVCSLGRCGSTMLVNNLKNYYHQQPSRMDIVRLDDHIQMDLVTDDSTIERGFDGEASMALRGQYLLGHVYKSHDFPPAYLPSHVKVIFLFGNPIDIVLSALELDKRPLTGVDSRFTALDLHIRNLRGDIKKKADLFDKDVLRLEEQFDCWFKTQAFPLLRLRYETMWEHQSEIRSFIGIDRFKLPKKKQRKYLRGKYNDSTLANLELNYSQLSKKIQNAPNFLID